MWFSFWKLLQARIDRTHFAAYLFSVTAVAVALGYRSGPMGDEYFIFWGIYFVVVTTLVVRRLHDIDFRGWWCIVLPALFFARTAILLSCGWGGCDSFVMMLYDPMLWLIGVLMIALTLVPGTKDTNRFGE